MFMSITMKWTKISMDFILPAWETTSQHKSMLYGSSRHKALLRSA